MDCADPLSASSDFRPVSSINHSISFRASTTYSYASISQAPPGFPPRVSVWHRKAVLADIVCPGSCDHACLSCLLASESCESFAQAGLTTTPPLKILNPSAPAPSVIFSLGKNAQGGANK